MLDLLADEVRELVRIITKRLDLDGREHALLRHRAHRHPERFRAAQHGLDRFLDEVNAGALSSRSGLPHEGEAERRLADARRPRDYRDGAALEAAVELLVETP